jgi:hypothetical protein
MAALEANPQAKLSLARTRFRLRTFAKGIETVGTSQHEVIDTFRELFAGFNTVVNHASAEQQRLMLEGVSDLQVEQQQAFTALATEIEKSLESAKGDLESHGFESPGNDLDGWEDLARIVEKEPGPMTIEEIYRWAIAWARREILRYKIARGETPTQIDGRSSHRSATTRSADNASIFRDEHDPRIAWCVGKRIYLGADTQISRLFWLLASPVGRACTLADVQRAIDGFETMREEGSDDGEFKQASQRVRKATSKLRAALREADVDEHLIIVRGGDRENPEYTMVLRFG